jgi:hypothetical protein
MFHLEQHLLAFVFAKARRNTYISSSVNGFTVLFFAVFVLESFYCDVDVEFVLVVSFVFQHNNA